MQRRLDSGLMSGGQNRSLPLLLLHPTAASPPPRIMALKHQSPQRMGSWRTPRRPDNGLKTGEKGKFKGFGYVE